MLKKLLFLRTNRLWQVCEGFMHTALFIELLRQGVPEVVTLWAMVRGLVTEHGTLVVLLMSMVLTRLPAESEMPETSDKTGRRKGKDKSKKPRDEKGRFVARDASRRKGAAKGAGGGRSRKSKA